MFCCRKEDNKKIHPKKEFKPISILKDNTDKDKIIKRVKRESIYPKIIEENQSKRSRQVFIQKFLGEIISCGACQAQFNSDAYELKISCGSCHKFFHCGIAGACVGPNCSIILDGKKESLKYCLGCVNLKLKINVLNNGQALCKTCEIDPSIDKKLLEV